MASINISIPHSLTKEEVAAKTKNLLSSLKEKYAGMIDSVNEEWNGNQGKFNLSAKGFDVSGTMSINDSSIEIEGKMPMALSFFKGTIEKSIRNTVEEALM
ncbi:MAG: polyhydroxyalkanoic acid system family protein [Chitinophagaceae bacterium]|nr:polyhydroxyalkanoic acid system family protein [Chitinophagaceae bacterium]